jgi:hypothetical protein
VPHNLVEIDKDLIPQQMINPSSALRVLCLAAGLQKPRRRHNGRYASGDLLAPVKSPVDESFKALLSAKRSKPTNPEKSNCPFVVTGTEEIFQSTNG